LVEYESKFPNIKIDKQIIMPDHIHVIMTINDLVGADLRVRPNDDQKRPAIPGVVQWFKTMTTNEYIRNVNENGWRELDKRLWQRDYYEHVIRDEKDYAEVWGYIDTNPMLDGLE
jgi:REP element-mobilizing transposase RayT